MSNSTIEDKDLVTSVTSVSIVNPLADLNYQLVEDDDVTIPLTFNWNGNQTDLSMLMVSQSIEPHKMLYLKIELLIKTEIIWSL